MNGRSDPLWRAVDEAGQAHLAGLWPRHRRAEGCYYTPTALAAALVDAALARLPGGPLRACDPSCGAGAFAVPLVQAMHRRAAAARGSVSLAEIDPAAAAVASALIEALDRRGGPRVRMLVGDALGGPVAERLWRRPHDLIVGNPPFAAGELRVPAGFPHDRAAAFIDRAVQNLAPRGLFVLILPRSISYIERWRTVRELLWRVGRLEEIVEIRRTIDVGMEQLGVVFARARAARGHRVSVRAVEGSGFVNRHRLPVAIARRGPTLGISLDPFSRSVLLLLERRSIPFAEIQPTIRRGLTVQRHLRPLERGAAAARRWIGRRDIDHFRLARGEALDPATELKFEAAAAWQEGCKLLVQRRVGRRVHPRPHLITRAALDEGGALRAVDTVLVVRIEEATARLLALLVLNSSLGAYYLERVAFDGNVLTTPDLDRPYLLRLFVPDVSGAARVAMVSAARAGDRALAERLLIEHYELDGRTVARISAERGLAFGSASTLSA